MRLRTRWCTGAGSITADARGGTDTPELSVEVIVNFRTPAPAADYIWRRAYAPPLDVRCWINALGEEGVYSTVTDLARLRGWSTSVPLITAV